MPGSFVQAAASIKGGQIAADASKKAAKLQNEQFQQTRRDLLPFLDFGKSALGPLSRLFGLTTPGSGVPGSQGARNPEFDRLQGLLSGTSPTIEVQDRNNRESDLRGTRQEANPEFANLSAQLAQTDQFLPAVEGEAADPFADFIESPGFRFRLEEGQKALDRSASSRGQLLSGQQVKASQDFGQNLASAEFNNFVDRLASFAGIGQTTGAQIGQLGANAALARGSFVQAAGGQRASGLIGAANALAAGQARQENNFLSIFGAGAGAAGGGAGAAGGGAGAAAFFCAIAREVYGNDPKWMSFREWLFREAPVWLFKWYGRNQYRVASFLANKPKLKWLVRQLMDRVI